MRLVQLHPFGACSSLILYDLVVADREYFLTALCHMLAGDIPSTPTLDEGINAFHMSFVVASTQSHQIVAISGLEFLGFKKCGTAYNAKNNTEPTFWFITVPDLLKNLQEKFEELSYEGRWVLHSKYPHLFKKPRKAEE